MCPLSGESLKTIFFRMISACAYWSDSQRTKISNASANAPMTGKFLGSGLDGSFHGGKIEGRATEISP